MEKIDIRPSTAVVYNFKDSLGKDEKENILEIIIGLCYRKKGDTWQHFSFNDFLNFLKRTKNTDFGGSIYWLESLIYDGYLLKVNGNYHFSDKFFSLLQLTGSRKYNN